MPVYRGTFGRKEAERLLWRAGFGPRPGEAARVARKGLKRAVDELVYPPRARMIGKAPTDDDGAPLAPRDAWGHDHLWWLDRMVRSNQPLVERMTLIWHDWFATSNDGVGSQKWMLVQNQTMRTYALGSFESLLLALTHDPAMLLWLNGNQNTRWDPNENYARELMELFTLGAGQGYTEDDVREQARALTGWRNDWREGLGDVNFRYDPNRHDTGMKVIFGQSAGTSAGMTPAASACAIPPTPRSSSASSGATSSRRRRRRRPKRRCGRSTAAPATRSSRSSRPSCAIRGSTPARAWSSRLIVQLAGMHRARNRPVDTDAWSWISELDGQRLFLPPNVAGWNEDRWLDTSSMRGRWTAANYVAMPYALDTDEWRGKLPLDPGRLVNSALAFWGNPTIAPASRQALQTFAAAALSDADQNWERAEYPVLIVNALRMLVAISPDYQTC